MSPDDRSRLVCPGLTLRPRRAHAPGSPEPDPGHPEPTHLMSSLASLLRRLSASPQASAFVLRGGLLTRLWAGPSRRVTRDIDLLALFPRQEVAERVLAWVGSEGFLSQEAIWQETDFPGERFQVEVDGEPVQIDVGFGDPLEPPAGWLDYPLVGGPARVLAAAPELMAAWKLDGLIEHGVRRWRAKDLHDLWLITGCCRLDADVLRRAARVAFDTHRHDIGATLRLLHDAAWWGTEAVRLRWDKYRGAAGVDVPADVVWLAAEVAARLTGMGVGA